MTAKEFLNRRYRLYWTTRTKNKILLSSMKDDHLANCINFIKRRRRNRNDRWLEILEYEYNYRTNKSMFKFCKYNQKKYIYYVY